MSAQPTLRTERLVLRPFEATDAPSVQSLCAAAAVADTTLSIPHPYEDGMAAAWIETHRPAFANGEQVVFAITEPAVGLVGAVGLRLELKHCRGELGYWIGEPYWGRGYATEAVLALLSYAFTALDLNRVEARHMSRNPASGRVMQKAGMRREGQQRQHILKNGRFEDLEYYAVLRQDFAT